jgi:sec-independent protein translocase protein TatA
MFDIGLQELVLIFVIALLVFGPKNLPQLGRSLGRAMREFRRASDEFRSTIETNLELNAPDPGPAAPEPATAGSYPGTAVAEEASPAPVPGETREPSPVEPPPGEAFVAQRGGRLFHRRDCSWVRRIAEPERVYFKQVAEAKEAGHLVCPSCDPWEPV